MPRLAAWETSVPQEKVGGCFSKVASKPGSREDVDVARTTVGAHGVSVVIPGMAARLMLKR